MIVEFNENDFERKIEPSTSYERAIELTGYGRFNIGLIIVCGGCLMAVQTDGLSASYLLPAAQCDFHLSAADKGLLSSICFIGYISSSHLWGYLADTQGRRNITIYCMIISFITTFLAAFVESFQLFITLRYFTGFFLSVPTSTIFAYLGEFHSNQYRASSIAYASIIMSLGILLLPVIAWIIISMSWSVQLWGDFIFRPWRLFMLVCGLPNLIFGLLLFLYPESPKFLLSVGKHDQSLDILRNIHKINNNRNESSYEVRHLEVPNIEENFEKETKSLSIKNIFNKIINQIIPLFKPPLLKHNIFACIIQFGLFMVSTGLLIWYSDIINQISQKENKNLSVCDALASPENSTSKNETNLLLELCDDHLNMSVYSQNFLIGIAYIVGYLFVGSLVNVVGSKCILLTCQVFSLIAGIGLIFVKNLILIQVFFLVLLVLTGIGVGVVYMIVVELFPTNFRGMALSMCVMIGRLGCVAASSVIGLLLEINCLLTFGSFDAVLVIIIIFTLLLPSSKTQRTEGKQENKK